MSNDSIAYGDFAGMHRKSLEAAHQLTSGDESNKEDDDEHHDGPGNNPTSRTEGNAMRAGNDETGDEQDKSHGSSQPNVKPSAKLPSPAANHPVSALNPAHPLAHHLHPTPTSEAAGSYMASYAAAQLHHATRSPVDDFRMSSVAELRAKAAEHQARLAGAGFSIGHHHLPHPVVQQSAQQQQSQRDGEFLISSDSSSSF